MIQLSDDIAELFCEIADHLFERAAAYLSDRRQCEANLAGRVAIEVAIHARYVIVTGKVGSPATPKACINVLRSQGAIDKGTYRVLDQLLQGRGQPFRRGELAALAAKLYNPGRKPKSRDERLAKTIYSGVTQAAEMTRSAVGVKLRACQPGGNLS